MSVMETTNVDFMDSDSYSLNFLPLEVQFIIMDYMSDPDLWTLYCVSRHFREAVFAKLNIKKKFQVRVSRTYLTREICKKRRSLNLPKFRGIYFDEFMVTVERGSRPSKALFDYLQNICTKNLVLECLFNPTSSKRYLQDFKPKPWRNTFTIYLLQNIIGYAPYTTW